MSFNYTTLKTAIQNWTENDDTDFTDNIDTIIDLAELRILKEVDLTVARKSDNSSTQVANFGEVTTGLPTDIVVLRWVKNMTSGEMLLPKDESYILEYNSNSSSGTLKFYSWSNAGDQLRVAPQSNSALTLEIGYTYRITGLSDSNATNWLSTNAPDVLLYACLVESVAFMKEPPMEGEKWTSLYSRAIETLRIEEERRRRTDEYRTPEKRG